MMGRAYWLGHDPVGWRWRDAMVAVDRQDDWIPLMNLLRPLLPPSYDLSEQNWRLVGAVMHLRRRLAEKKTTRAAAAKEAAAMYGVGEGTVMDAHERKHGGFERMLRSHLALIADE
jgi:hypothetical protein